MGHGKERLSSRLLKQSRLKEKVMELSKVHPVLLRILVNVTVKLFSMTLKQF